jgi:hypothetical protein
MARTFKYSNSEVEFPDAIWAELVTSAIYILNRTGKSSKDGVSPYELSRPSESKSYAYKAVSIFDFSI